MGEARNIMDWRIVCGFGCVFLVTSGLATAGPTGRADPFNGKELAKKLCANSHIVDSQQQEAMADVPSFNEIANKEGQTAAAIMGHIILPQHPMPEIPLTQDELSDLTAYILSMRKSG
jgi:cytochrome c